MKRTFLTSTLLALALIGAVPAAPAAAGGSIGLTLSASDGEARRALNRFLRFYGGGSAEVVQRGSDNAAAIEQTGTGNRAVVSQRGDGHVGTVNQSGRGNRLGLFQFGRASDVAVTQDGRRESTLVFVRGW